MRHWTILPIILPWLLGPVSVLADDWPQYRGDAARSGYTSERLPRNLTIRWVRHARHAPRPAWVGRSLARSRMKFDWAFGTVVADGRCFFGSSADDKIHALDAATGTERWSFFTGGPVRLAPAVYRGRVYAVSDDGFLYCISAADGKQLWRVRGRAGRDLLVGNGRMVSRWVARGGPAVRDGIVYFGAGIWPIEGVAIFAVDAETGNVLWCNDSSGALEIDQPHMQCFSRGGVASQGYLAVARDHVLVTTGRSVPAAFDRKTGRFLHFNLSRYGGKTPWGVGGGDVVATDEVFFNSGIAFDIATGLRYHDVGTRLWWKAFTRDGRKCHGEFLVGQRQAISVTPRGLVRSEGSTLYGSSLTAKSYNARRELETATATPRLPTVEMVDAKRRLERIDNAPFVEDRWSVEINAEPRSLVVAAESIVVGTAGKVLIVDCKSKKTVWSAEVDGTVHALAVADGRLFASTDRGTIYCFGRNADNARPTIVRPRSGKSPYPTDGIAAKAAEEIVGKTGVNKGYCLDLDCGDGALAHALARRTELSVVALTADPTEAEAARRKLDTAGVYGTRVAVVVGRPDDLPDYFANLIVSSAALTGGTVDQTREQLTRIQRPSGGVVCIGRVGKLKADVRGELPGGGSWTHNLADAGNTMNSGDTIAKGPLGMLWYRDETQETIDRHGKNPAPLAYKGLLLREGIDGITCTDAYNGTLLWEAKLPGVLAAYREGTQVGAGQIGGTYCVDADVLYVRLADGCLLFDVFSGKRLDRFKAPRLPDGKTGRWAFVACKDGVLYGSLMNEGYVIKAQHGDGGPRMQKSMEDHLTESSSLFAVDAKTGELKWTFRPKHSIRNNAIAVGDGLIYVIDRPAAEIDKILRSTISAKRRGGPSLPSHPTGVLLALDAESGEPRWRDDRDVFGTTLAVSTTHDVLLMGYNAIGFARASDWPQGMRAYRASNGEQIWQSNRSARRPAIVGRTIYGFPMAWDLLTGRPKTAAVALPDRKQGDVWRIQGKGQGCGLVAGSQNLLLLRSATIAYYDLTYDRGWLENYGGIRAGCFINALAAGGIVLVPDDTRACRCSYQNQATIALKQHGMRPPEIEPQLGQSNFRYHSIAKEPVFTGRLIVTISHHRPDVELRYTLDDSTPRVDSPLYAGPITLSETTPVRAAAFLDGKKMVAKDAVVFRRVLDLDGKKRNKKGKREL